MNLNYFEPTFSLRIIISFLSKIDFLFEMSKASMFFQKEVSFESITRSTIILKNG